MVTWEPWICSVLGSEYRNLLTIEILSVHFIMFKLFSQRSLPHQKSEKVMQAYPLWLQEVTKQKCPFPSLAWGCSPATQNNPALWHVTGTRHGYCNPAFSKVCSIKQRLLETLTVVLQKRNLWGAGPSIKLNRFPSEIVRKCFNMLIFVTNLQECYIISSISQCYLRLAPQ